MYSCFLFVIQSRVFFHFAWIFGAGGREFIFMFAGGMDIFVPGRATYEPSLPLYRGYPLPCCLRSPGRPPQKNTPARPSSSAARPRFPPFLVPACCWFLPGSICSAPFPPAAALLLATISLNTYLANRKFTHYRPFAVASGYSASILYPHRSRLRL